MTESRQLEMLIPITFGIDKIQLGIMTIDQYNATNDKQTFFCKLQLCLKNAAIAVCKRMTELRQLERC